MARHKDGAWILPDNLTTWDQVKVALLMDIRDELQNLNGLLHCHNFRRIPAHLNAIRENTTKKRKNSHGQNTKVSKDKTTQRR